MTQNAKIGNFTMVQNDFIMAACQTCHGCDLAVVMAIYRFTWGFQKQSAPLSLKTLSKYTGIKKTNVSRTLQVLIDRNIVKVYKETEACRPRHIGINELKEWATGAVLEIDQDAEKEVSQGTEAPSKLPVPVSHLGHNPTKEECIEYGKFLNQPEKFGELFYLKLEGQGWLNGNGQKIQNWKAYMERYIRNEEMYNNLMGLNNGHGQSKTVGAGYRGRDEGVELDKYNELFNRSQRQH